ncbi:5'(3')-deoxyribonucleotidase [Moorella glycerini]|uniref:5' nucleotidase, deoxy (Pyrimidine), cytosolic type C protein n=1 Tax=Neomoorella stamsii TaxID=1266720 RepID=A0A9X7J4H9_9FIRM|nr:MULTISPECIES: hypothetical protein [Moorella]PRR76289.1 5' nucleotidase, deoxy (Pyrimidine), cytosolic type C protein [Moorella stamsii]CEP67143.1 5'(3')-deoxyribonucleotidase [Moorella glycerini]
MLPRKWMEGPGRMRLGVDICNTIANVNAEILRRYDVSLEVYPFPELPPDFFSTTEGLTLLARAKPLPGAVEVLGILSRLGHEIVYMTSRPILAIDLTREWLAAHGFPRGSIVFLPRGYKKVFAAHYGIGLFFEDDPIEAAELQEAVGQVYMPAWPYNKNVKGRYIKRFNSWKDIQNLSDCHLRYRMVL